MDSISKAKKAQSMNKYKIHQFLNNLILHSLAAFVFALFCSYPFWFPQLCACLNHFLFTSLPNLKSFFINPKFLFVVGNAIVIFLVGESKFATSSLHSSSQSCKDSSSFEKSQDVEESSIQMDLKQEKAEESDTLKAIEEKYLVDEEKDGDDEVGDVDGSEKEAREEEDAGLPAEELNKRVEDFIARVNRQRWIESTQVAFGRG